MEAREEVEKILENYVNDINNIDPNTWSGTSREYFTKKATESITECSNVLSSQLTDLETAIEKYTSWKEANRYIQYYDDLLEKFQIPSPGRVDERNPNSSPKRVIDNYVSKRKSWVNKEAALRNEINTILEKIKTQKLEEKELTATDSFVKFYKKDYTDASYGNGTTIASAGGGPLAMAMVISTLTDKEVSPVDAANWSLEHGYRSYGNGTAWAYVEDYATENGLNCTQSNVNADSIMTNLKEGNPVVMVIGEGTYTDEGQFIVLTGVTDDGKIEIVDPGSEEKSKQTYDLDLFLNEGTQQWIISN